MFMRNLHPPGSPIIGAPQLRAASLHHCLRRRTQVWIETRPVTRTRATVAG
jgi:hypothetical protein